MVKEIAIVFLIILLSACAVKMPEKNQYKLEAFCAQKISAPSHKATIFISQPDAVSGYNTEQMLYVKKPYKVTPFSKNAWVGSPADMLFPLIVQSLQASRFFAAISSAPNGDKADYRLDTQLISLQQNFLVQPSRLDMVIKATLSDIDQNRVVGSHIFNLSESCPIDSPYGGVIAANHATKRFTNQMVRFVTGAIKQRASYE